MVDSRWLMSAGGSVTEAETSGFGALGVSITPKHKSPAGDSRAVPLLLRCSRLECASSNVTCRSLLRSNVFQKAFGAVRQADGTDAKKESCPGCPLWAGC